MNAVAWSLLTVYMLGMIVFGIADFLFDFDNPGDVAPEGDEDEDETWVGVADLAGLLLVLFIVTMVAARVTS